MKNKSAALLPHLQAQMQWMAGSPQTTSSAINRLLYDFNNSGNVLHTVPGVLSGITEISTAQQESTICDPETGKWILFFNGNDIYDGLKNKVNENEIETVDHTALTSLIAPSLSRKNENGYNIFYIEKSTHALNYAIVTFPNGLKNEAHWVGIQSLSVSTIAAPISIACVNENEYWILTLANPATLVAYKCDTSGENIIAPVHIPLQPFSSMINDSIDLLKSSIVVNKDKIAITINGTIMYGNIDVSTKFTITSQKLLDHNTETLMPAFNATNDKLYYLKSLDSNSRNHVWVCDLDTTAFYSANTTTHYNNSYVTLKLAPSGTIYGTNLFISIDPILVIQEDLETGFVEISETLSENQYSSRTFGNIQYQINTLKNIG